MKMAQFTLTVSEAKLLIADAVFQSELFQNALQSHRILFKGSTTVSALSQLAVKTPLRICGRMIESGMRGQAETLTSPHWLLCENGKLSNVDETIVDVAKTFTTDDLMIVGANAIDAFGNAAMLMGSPGGGSYGGVLGCMYTEGFKTLVLSTTDKLIFGNVNDLYKVIERKGCDYSFGMSCGLAPAAGELITELNAVKMIANVEAFLFARGGLETANGASAIQISGKLSEVEKVLEAVGNVKNREIILGDEASLKPCTFPSVSCANHLSCKYANKNKIL